MNTDTKHFLVIIALSLLISFQPALIMEYFNFHEEGLAKWFGVPLFMLSLYFGIITSSKITNELKLSREKREREREEYLAGLDGGSK